MAWAKVDDDAPLSRKFFRAGVAAFGLDVAAWCYCNREGTDGYVPTRDLPIVFPGLQLSRAVALAVKLVEVGRWSVDGEGYRIHDFHEYQFSADQIAERRRKRAEAGRLGGLRSGATRRSNQPSNSEANASTAAKQMSNPVPVPVPVPLEASTALSSSHSTSNGTSELREHARAVLAFLNEKAGRHFRDSPTNLAFIVGRLKSGASVEDCRSIIARKAREWGPDPKMTRYLRPETIFNATKFESYLGELGS